MDSSYHTAPFSDLFFQKLWNLSVGPCLAIPSCKQNETNIFCGSFSKFCSEVRICDVQKQLSRGIYKNFVKFKGKHLCQSLFWPATLFKKKLWHRHRCFPVNFAKFLRTVFYRTPLAAAFGFIDFKIQWALSNSNSQGESEFVRIMKSSD